MPPPDAPRTPSGRASPAKRPRSQAGLCAASTGQAGGHGAGPSHPRWAHGLRSREWTETRRLVSELARETREIKSLIR